ncbi:MAG: hypothetical protein R3C20_05920 [Planctomycetaceae bacterium]
MLNEEQMLYRGVLQWNDIRRKLITVSFKTIRSAEAQLLVDEVGKFLKDSGPYPGPMEMDDRLNALKAVASRKTGADGTLSDSIRGIFAARTISSCYLVTTTEGELFYTPQIPSIEGSIYRFNYFTTTTGTQTASKTLGRQKVRFGADGPKEDDWLSPQTKLWRQIMPVLTEESPDFEQDLLRIIELVLAADTVDPILRFLTLKKLLKLGAENSEFFRVRAEKLLKDLDQAGVSLLTNWVVFDDKRAAKDRSNAEFYLKNRQAEILAELKQVSADRSRLEKSELGPATQWVGWMHKDTDGRWVVSLPSVPVKAKGARLFVVGRDNADGAVKMFDIATYPEADTTKIGVPNADPTWPEGRPVFRLINGS